MNPSRELRSLLPPHRPGAGLLAALAVALAVNAVLVVRLRPEQERGRLLAEMRSLSESSVRLERLLTESDRARARWEGAGTFPTTLEEAVETVERSASRHRVQLSEWRPAEGATNPSKKADAIRTLTLDTQAVGAYRDLVLWMDALQRLHGIEPAAATLEAPGPGDTHSRLQIRLKAAVRNGSAADPAESPAADLSAALEASLARFETAAAAEEQQPALEFGRDPMQAAADGGAFYQELLLQGIVADAQGLRTALIGDKIYAVGSQIGPWKIVSIREDGIDVEKEGKTSFVPLYPGR